MDLASIKSLPKNKIVIVSTGSQGENMSALYRMAFSTHKQVDITAGDRIIISASAIPGNEKSISNIINELYRKGADVVYEKSEGLHVSGHACQEELKIVHGLVKPKFFIPMHFQGRPDVALRFAVTGETPQTRVIALEQPGDHIDLHLPEDETSAPDQKLKDLLKEEADD